MRSGSFCTGYGGLDLAVETVFATTPAWVSEVDKHACALLEQRFPGVPNVGDLTTADWSLVEPVELVTAGYPCQPFSAAGKRLGSKDERHLWPHIRDALRVLRPRLVVLENVSGHLALGFDAVLADLASLGFDAEWCLVRASDVGAPHRRERLFVLAHADTLGAGQRFEVGRADRQAEGEGLQRQRGRRAAGRSRTASSADADRGRFEGSGEQDERTPGGQPAPRRRDADGLDPDAPDAHVTGLEGREPAGRHVVPAGGAQADADASREPRRAPPLERPRSGEATGTGATGVAGRRDAISPDAEDERREWERVARGRRDGSADGVEWGPFEPAIRRWERTLGRCAPAPTDERGRLSPVFVEWMMGLSEGWVTDAVPTRSAQLRILGNGVVPQQAAYALAGLLARQEAA